MSYIHVVQFPFFGQPTETVMRCGYCAGADHTAPDCPGLRHDVAPARAFKIRFGWICRRCNHAPHAGRKLFDLPDSNERLCGDCVRGGTPLVAPKVEPLTAADCCAWQTACDEGVD